jgi:hypothetical protein
VAGETVFVVSLRRFVRPCLRQVRRSRAKVGVCAEFVSAPFMSTGFWIKTREHMMRPALLAYGSRNWTRKFAWATLAVALAAGVGSLAPHAQSPTDPSPLIGEWVLLTSDRPGNPSGIGIRRKTYTQTTWSMVQRDPLTGVIVFQHGGQYVLAGSNYTETVEYAGPSTAHLLGQVFTYRVTVGEDNTYTQVDGMWNETWRRAPREDPAPAPPPPTSDR